VPGRLWGGGKCKLQRLSITGVRVVFVVLGENASLVVPEALCLKSLGFTIAIQKDGNDECEEGGHSPDDDSDLNRREIMVGAGGRLVGAGVVGVE